MCVASVAGAVVVAVAVALGLVRHGSAGYVTDISIFIFTLASEGDTRVRCSCSFDREAPSNGVLLSAPRAQRTRALLLPMLKAYTAGRRWRVPGKLLGVGACRWRGKL